MASGFVTETEIAERKKVRQEEWERVRKPEDPEAAPEEPVDNRSLWERLEEQKQKKQMDWDEEHKFKNQFRGLNDDEVDFLDKVDDFRYDNLIPANSNIQLPRFRTYDNISPCQYKSTDSRMFLNKHKRLNFHANTFFMLTHFNVITFMCWPHDVMIEFRHYA